MNEELDTLKDALNDYFESCIRTGHYDMESNARFFCKENSHMNVNYNQVLAILEKMNNEVVLVH
jgi:hypothetical protein